jgi:hypothetical protein
MKFSGIAIPGYVFDKNDKLVPSKKRLSVSERIRRNKSKRTTVKRGKRLPG